MNSTPCLPDFLPGTLQLIPGHARDYHALSMFHYSCGPPATWAGVWVVRFFPRDRARRAESEEISRLAAVGVLSYPVPSCRAREQCLGLSGTRTQTLHFANQHIRTISRIVVHPQFRSLGLSSILVRQLIDTCNTRYVEAIARMGHLHPLFERAGMRRVNRDRENEPAYFIFDRLTCHCGASHGKAIHSAA